MDKNKDDNSGIAATQHPLSFPSDGWSADIRRMPFFTRAEMNDHISKSGKRIDPTSKAHSVPTSIRKVTTFLNDEYLKGISAASDDNYFYFRSHCYHSFRKNDAPHNLKVALRILSGEVKHATCSCVAGKVGFCNHILALLMKICKFSLYECKTVHELENEEDMQPKQACTSSLQRWHRKGRGDSINPQPAMEVLVAKTYLEQPRSSAREPGVRCTLYEARNNIRGQKADEEKLLATLKELNPNMALAQIMTPKADSIPLVETKFGRSPQGSYASYQLAVTEDNFKVFCDITSIRRANSANHGEHIVTYPRFPLSSQSNEQFEIPADLSEAEKSLLKDLQVDEDKLNGIEIKTRSQSECPEWKLERKFRFTVSNFGLIRDRKRNHESLVQNLINPKPFSSRYTNHGLKYEPIALEQYQKYMSSINKSVKVFKSGLVMSMDAPYLGASPDGKVIDPGCSDQFGLSEVKCPETKYLVTPLDACSDSSFFMEEVDGKPKLKHTHKYYFQVQGLMGVTGAKWCDFIVYTSKEMSIERIPFDVQFWNNLKDTLKLHYFKHFLAIAAREPRA